MLFAIQTVLRHTGADVAGALRVARHGVIVAPDVVLHAEERYEPHIAMCRQRIGKMRAVRQASAVIRHERDRTTAHQLGKFAEQAIGTHRHHWSGGGGRLGRRRHRAREQDEGQ